MAFNLLLMKLDFINEMFLQIFQLLQVLKMKQSLNANEIAADVSPGFPSNHQIYSELEK